MIGFKALCDLYVVDSLLCSGASGYKFKFTQNLGWGFLDILHPKLMANSTKNREMCTWLIFEICDFQSRPVLGGLLKRMQSCENRSGCPFVSKDLGAQNAKKGKNCLSNPQVDQELLVEFLFLEDFTTCFATRPTLPHVALLVLHGVFGPFWDPKPLDPWDLRD